MESFWRRAGVQLGKQWKVVAAAVVVVTVLLGVGLTRIEFATGQDSYLNPDSQIAIDNVEFQDNFGGETVILLFTAQDGNDISDLYAGTNLAELRRLNVDLAEVDNVFSVITPLTSLTYSDALIAGPGQSALISAASRDADGAGPRGENISLSLARLGQVPEEERGLDPSVDGPEPDPIWIDLLIFDNTGVELVDGEPRPPADDERGIRLSLASTFPNQQTAVGGVVLDGNLDLDSQSAATEELLTILETAQFDGFDLTVTGSPVYLKEINDYLKGGMLTLGLIALAVMAVVLALMFRVRWRLLPLLAVMVGALWTFSILGWIGIDLSLVTISGLPILIGLGIDFAIQIHNRVEEEVVLDRDEHPIAETVANLAPPLIVAALAGVVAFLALRLSKVPMIRDFGVLLAIGVVVLVTIGIIVPAATLGIREWTKPTEERGPSLVERIVVKLGGLPMKAGLGLLIGSVFLFVGGILVEGRTKIESDPIKWIDQGSEVVGDVRRLEDETGFAHDPRCPRAGEQRVRPGRHRPRPRVHDRCRGSRRGRLVVELVNTMAKIIQIPGATVISPTEDDLVGAAEAAASRTPDIARALSIEDQTATQVNLRLAPASLEERAVLVEDLKADLQARIDALEIDADSILRTDLPDEQDAVERNTGRSRDRRYRSAREPVANRAELTYLALCLAGLFLVLRFRSFSRALLALVPVFLAVGASSLIVGLLGIQLSPLTTVSGPLVIASCTEFSVLIFGRYLEERQRALAPRDASDTAAARTGRAFFTSAVTTIGGFAVLIVSPLPLLRDFGLIVTLNVSIALLAALVADAPDDGLGRQQGVAGDRCPDRSRRIGPAGRTVAWRSDRPGRRRRGGVRRCRRGCVRVGRHVVGHGRRRLLLGGRAADDHDVDDHHHDDDHDGATDHDPRTRRGTDRVDRTDRRNPDDGSRPGDRPDHLPGRPTRGGVRPGTVRAAHRCRSRRQRRSLHDRHCVRAGWRRGHAGARPARRRRHCARHGPPGRCRLRRSSRAGGIRDRGWSRRLIVGSERGSTDPAGWSAPLALRAAVTPGRGRWPRRAGRLLP